MRTNVTTSIVVTLVLSQEEAAWLHGAMQNPIGYSNPSEELHSDAEMRRKFFEATQPSKEQS